MGICVESGIRGSPSYATCAVCKGTSLWAALIRTSVDGAGRWGTLPGAAPILGAMLCPPAEGAIDNSEYPALPSQEQDPGSQEALAIDEQGPLAAALLEASPLASDEGQVDGVDVSGALFSSSEEKETGEGFVDGDGYLVERARV